MMNNLEYRNRVLSVEENDYSVFLKNLLFLV